MPIRRLAREAHGIASIRWAQSGFSAQYGDKAPRNMMGFKDGTINPQNALDYDRFVWVGDEGPAWMRGGSYVVARLVRIAIEHWDRMDLDYQQQTIGRDKFSGAPLGGTQGNRSARSRSRSIKTAIRSSRRRRTRALPHPR